MSALDSGLEPARLPADKLPAYSAHHRAKHELLRRYMDVWMPKLGFTYDQVALVDDRKLGQRERRLGTVMVDDLDCAHLLVCHEARGITLFARGRAWRTRFKTAGGPRREPRFVTGPDPEELPAMRGRAIERYPLSTRPAHQDG